MPTAFPFKTCATAASALLLAACAGGRAPALPELPPFSTTLTVQQIWTVRLPAGTALLPPSASGDTVAVAAADGTVLAIDALSGRERWRARVGAALLAGAGSDGDTVAVVSAGNELIALADGQVRWRQRLGARAYTAPLVADGRVFVQTGDRTVGAWDVGDGHRLWSKARTPDPLMLGRPGVLAMAGDTLVAGAGGRLTGLMPADGGVRWEAPIATPRGTDDVDRLVDLTGGVSRQDHVVCARAYDAAVGCVDTRTGLRRWARSASGSEGLDGTPDLVVGSESSGSVVAWRRDDGTPAWRSERFRDRGLTAPLVVGRALAVAERSGTVHFLSGTDGAPLARVTPDGSAIAAAPVLAGGTVVVATRDGGVFGYRVR
ncbi:MAG TPA: outer membrane protein assembly factor BamB [Variovorax sp.]|nr:outer membrane protein assembly factor BamB [Variovorax sp.]